jgi:hypothetical protein
MDGWVCGFVGGGECWGEGFYWGGIDLERGGWINGW